MKNMTIWMVRHGETAKNKDHLLQGRSDAPLNSNGQEQAEEARMYFQENHISFDHVISSPLLRALQTAEIITDSKLGIRRDQRLLEMDYGPYEGCSLESPPEEITYFFQDFVHHPAPEGMESLSSVKERMGSFLEDLKSSERGNILVTTHAIALKGALEYLMPESDGAWWSRTISTCAVFKIELDEGRFLAPEEVFHTRKECRSVKI